MDHAILDIGKADHHDAPVADAPAFIASIRARSAAARDARAGILAARRSARTCMVLTGWNGGGATWHEQDAGYDRASLIARICEGQYDNIIAIVEIDGTGNARNIEAEIAATLAKLPVEYDPETGDPYLDMPGRVQIGLSQEAGDLTARFGFGDICDRTSEGKRA